MAWGVVALGLPEHPQGLADLRAQSLQGATDATAGGVVALGDIEINGIMGGHEAGLEGNAAPFQFRSGQQAGGKGPRRRKDESWPASSSRDPRGESLATTMMT